MIRWAEARQRCGIWRQELRLQLLSNHGVASQPVFGFEMRCRQKYAFSRTRCTPLRAWRFLNSVKDPLMIQATVNPSRLVARQTRGTAPSLVTEDVPCGICGKWARKRLYTEHYRLQAEQVELGINRCGGCGQVYVSPRLDRAAIQRVYTSDAERTISHHYCWADLNSDERFAPLVNRILSRIAGGRLLDIGCGSGSFLAAVAARGNWELTGLEPCQPAAEQARKRGVAEIHALTLEQAELAAGSFDVVTLLGVLEHLHDPLSTLRIARRLLKPDGVLGIYVPNFNYLRCKDAGPLAFVRRRKWSCLAPQEHLFHFTPDSLTQLIRRSGFDVTQLDVGRPFMQRSRWKRGLKQLAYSATVALHRCTGIHLGGLEVLARPCQTTQVESRHDDTRSVPQTNERSLP